MAAINCKKSSQDDIAYEYLCRLEEAKKWIESVLGEEVPATTELEDALQNGVYLCRLGMVLQPEEEMWKKVYDLDQSKFKVKGLHYRYTDNINFWLESLSKLGLPKVFYPVMTDIFHKKDTPKLIYCLHALSHLMKKRGLVQNAVSDVYGSAKFPHDALVNTSQNLQTIKYKEMPAFGVVENLVEEELQYQAMGLCEESYEEETGPRLSRSSSLVISTAEEAKELFDDPTYISNAKVPSSGKDESVKLIELSCVSENLKVILYACSVTAIDKPSPLQQSIQDFNMQLSSKDPEATFTDLQKVIKAADSKSIILIQSYTKRYYEALLEEKKEGLPGSVLPVYSGMDRDMCDGLLESMSPGAYIVRKSNTIEGAYVFSFRNHTGIKHWKLSTKNSKFFWGTSSLYSSLDSFVGHFVDALSLVTKLHLYYGMNSSLQPVIQTTEEQAVMDTLHQADEDLTYGQMTRVIKDINSEVRKERKSVQYRGDHHGDHHGDHQVDHQAEYQSDSDSDSNSWNMSMIIEVKKVEAEKILNSKGEKGSFLIRPSERTVGDYALAFKTNTDIRHWRIVHKGGKYFVHPRPNPYISLEDIIEHFQEAVGQETGLTMVPLVHEPPKEEEPDEDLGSPQNGGTSSNLLRLPPPPNNNSVSACGPSQSMSRLNPANLTSWSVEDVCFWLLSQNLGNFVDTFKDNEVDGECLMTLDNKLLKDDLSITALGHRSRILKRVQALKNEFHPV